MLSESAFLRELIGKPVRIAVADEEMLPPHPPLVLQEISGLGVVASDGTTSHFFPWNEIVEITPRENGGLRSDAPDPETIEAALEVDSEP